MDAYQAALRGGATSAAVKAPPKKALPIKVDNEEVVAEQAKKWLEGVPEDKRDEMIQKVIAKSYRKVTQPQEPQENGDSVELPGEVDIFTEKSQRQVVRLLCRYPGTKRRILLGTPNRHNLLQYDQEKIRNRNTMSFLNNPAFALSYALNPSYAAAYSGSSDDEEDDMPWERDNWIPRTKSGRQTSPNQIRGQLSRYIDAHSVTKSHVMNEMGVTAPSFYKFMDPNAYKDQWKATKNQTYWAAARFLAKAKHEEEQEKKASKGKKRKATAADGEENCGNSVPKISKKTKKHSKADAIALMNKINSTEVANTTVYDSCPEIAKKIKDFVAQPGFTKADFCDALGGINSNSLRTFLMGKKQDQCGNVTYRRAYAFFEKKRVLEGQAKSARRLKNEAEHPNGFSLEKERHSRAVYVVAASSYRGGWFM